MEKFAVDLDAVLDEFELNEGKSPESAFKTGIYMYHVMI